MHDTKNTMIGNWFQKVWNEDNPEAIADFLSEDVIGHGVKPDGSTHGIEAFKKFFHDFRSEFKNINVTVSGVIVEDNMESAICDVKALHTPTNTMVDFSGICSIRKENGKAVEAWNQFDYLKMYQQIGYELVQKKS